MWCGIVKWWVSRSLDTHKPLPFLARKHLLHCADCRQFETFGRTLEESVLTPEQLKTEEPFRRRILAGLDAGTDQGQVEKTFRILKWKPATAGALFGTLLLLGFIWIAGPFRSTSSALGGFKEVDISSFKKMISAVESPYEEEISELKQGIEAVGANIKSFFDSRL